MDKKKQNSEELVKPKPVLCESCYTPLTEIEVECSTNGQQMCFSCLDKLSESYSDTHEYQQSGIDDIYFS